MTLIQKLFFNALPKTCLAFVTHRAENGEIMTVCLEGEQQEAIVYRKKLNIIIRRGTLFLCQYEKAVEDGQHKFIVTKAIELNEAQPIYKTQNVWNSLRLFQFTIYTNTSVIAKCKETNYVAKLIVDMDCSTFTSGDIVVGWARFEDRNNTMGAQWYLIEVEDTLNGWNEKYTKPNEYKLTPLDLAL